MLLLDVCLQIFIFTYLVYSGLTLQYYENFLFWIHYVDQLYNSKKNKINDTCSGDWLPAINYFYVLKYVLAVNSRVGKIYFQGQVKAWFCN